MISKLGICVFVLVFFGAGAEIWCPFKSAFNRWNCERSSEDLRYFAEHPEQRVCRPDVDNYSDPHYDKNATAEEIDRALSYGSLCWGCCYEMMCLKECGINLQEEVDKSKFSELFPAHVGIIVENHPKFFVYINSSEIAVLESGNASDVLLEKWSVYIAHLNKELATNTSKQGF